MVIPVAGVSEYVSERSSERVGSFVTFWVTPGKVPAGNPATTWTGSPAGILSTVYEALASLEFDSQGVCSFLVCQQATFEIAAGPVTVTWKFLISDSQPLMTFQLNSSSPLTAWLVAIKPVTS